MKSLKERCIAACKALSTPLTTNLIYLSIAIMTAVALPIYIGSCSLIKEQRKFDERHSAVELTFQLGNAWDSALDFQTRRLFGRTVAILNDSTKNSSAVAQFISDLVDEKRIVHADSATLTKDS